MMYYKKKQKKNRAIAYRVTNVYGLHILETTYHVDIMDIPAIYVFQNGKMYQFELEEENLVMERFMCEVGDI